MRGPFRAAAAVVLSLLFVLAVSCSSGGEDGRTEGSTREARSDAETRGGGGREPTVEETRGPRAAAPGQPVPPRSLVPIAHLTSLRESVSMRELSRVRNLAVPEGSLETAETLLDRGGFEGLDSVDAVVEHVSRRPGATGLVPWDAVGPEVKALAVGGEALLEPGGAGLPGYPLRPEGGTGPKPEELRRVVIGGDVVLDRGQSYMVIQQGLGLRFPLDGGYAAITRRVPEPSAYSETGTIHQFTAERVGGSGAVRKYLRGADLTLANFENPVIRDAVYHPEATTFTGDLRLMPILEDAGIDGVTLGNNHILDAGTAGLEETLGHLDDAGIAHAGAGTDLASAREPMVFDLGGTRVGVLSYLGVPTYDWAWAAEGAPGTAPLLEEIVREDVGRLREQVDLVVVMPHWGKEYLATPEPGQVELAHVAVDAGADLVVGGHAHWPKGMEVYKGKPVFYGVGNFLLDQSWSEETSTGVFAEITLRGDRVIQVENVPFVLLDYAQPNFLVPGAGGDRALRGIFSASLGPEFEAYDAAPIGR